MELKCEICGTVNPAINRYCGQCGKRLERAAPDFPEDFWRDSEQAHDNLEREAELHDYAEHAGEPHFQTRAREETEREHQQQPRSQFLRWDMPIRVEDTGDDNVTAKYPQPSGSTAAPKSSEPRRTGVSGPSFLGLTDDVMVEEDEEVEPSSHVARNVVLAVIVVVVVLAALEWRSIRDYGLAYIQNGSMRVIGGRGKSAQKNPPAVAADNTGLDLGLSPAPAKPGTPQPTQSSPNADHPLPVKQAENAPTSNSSSSTTANATPTSTPPNTAANTTAANAAHGDTNPSPADKSAKPTAMSAPNPDVPEGHSPSAAPSTKDHALAKSTKAKTEQAASRHTPPAAPAAASVPGADEMNRAARASDAEARAAWLWKAVGKGNHQAPVELARMYERGVGVVRNCDQARLLLRSASAKGNAEARTELVRLSLNGCY